MPRGRKGDGESCDRRSKVCFFRAEDGIRGAQESRGLGDVYKRQHGDAVEDEGELNEVGREAVGDELLGRDAVEDEDGGDDGRGDDNDRPDGRLVTPVSYTHLTLPTIYSV